MKKFKVILAMVTAVYGILAVASYCGMKQIDANESHKYRIEINRICERLKAQEEVDLLVINDLEEVKSVSYLAAEETNTETIKKFYQTSNTNEIEIVPFVKDNQLKGYLRFEHQTNDFASRYILWAEAALFLIYFVILIVLLYIGTKIIAPFQKLSNMPVELAKGNLREEIKESKSRYFGRFIWGIGMLKDTLEDQKKKELRLLKDKKLTMLSLSHDIKTPLNAIVLYTKALEEGIYSTEEEKDRAISQIREKALEINDYVKQIVQSSKEDVVMIEVKNSEFYLSDLVKKIEEGYLEKCFLRHIEFTVASYDNILLKGDLDRLYEAAGNLIENAFKYGDGKKITITFDQEEYCQLIHVRNSGTVINDQEMSHIFDSFFRGSNAQGKEGNGLGLYICSEIMRKMQGDIFASQLEDGMEFVLVCPIQ